MMTTLSCYLELSFSISGHGSHPTIPKTKHAKVFLVCVFVLQKEIDTLESHELKVNRIFTSLVVCGADCWQRRAALRHPRLIGDIGSWTHMDTDQT